MKTAFILAGFDLKETAKDGYFRLAAGLKKQGYRVVPVDISWRYKIPSDYAKEFVSFYTKHKSEKNIVIGNSFGAVIAFLTTAELRPDRVYLCSLSPFFAEDRGKHPDDYGPRWFGIKRTQDLWAISARQIAAQINKTSTNMFVLYGSKEHQSSPVLVSRCLETAGDLKNVEVIEVPDAPHDMGDDTYTDAVLEFTE